MPHQDGDKLRSAIAALEGQRATLGDAVVDLALAPLRARLSALQRSAGLQHRQVTVMFADVVGSTAMIHTLEAEDALDLLNSALQRMAAQVEAHRGRVLRFTGDGLKAVFGGDEAREDDAERAVRAGLAILAVGREQADEARRLHGIADFAVRVGVHTGDVAMGAGIEQDDTAIGAAVHVAARMEQSAPPGALRISHDTWSQVRGLFDLTSQPPLLVKGIELPMRTYLVQGARERHEASVERGLEGLATPMVGRDGELQRLLGAIERTRQTGRLQAMTLLGDAGLGKSRLMRELAARLVDCRVLTLRSPPDGALRPWGLLRSLLVAQCGLTDQDSVEDARRCVVDGLSPWFDADANAERQAHLIGQLAGLDFNDSPHVRGLEPHSLRDQACSALVAYLHGLALRGGTLPVLLIEDLQWADDGSLDLLRHLVEHAAELPMALLMTARPTLLERHPDGGTGAEQIRLGPLGAGQIDALAAALLQRLDTIPPRLTELIIGRAEGNPYYLEELVRRLIDEGVIVVGEPRWSVRIERLDHIRLPATLVGLLQARLDALPADERQAARQASVIGHVFWDDALQALDARAPDSLPALQRAAYVHRRDTSDIEGTAERQFDHHLLHEVTYDTLLKAERRRSHGAVARWLSSRARGRSAEFLALTGEHAARAGETALAIDAFEQAGREAQRRYANAMAAAWLQRALDLLGDTDPERRLQLLARLETLADTVGDRAGQEALHADMAAVLAQHPHDQGQALLHWCRALLADRRSDAATAQQHAQQASELAERSGAAHTAARSRGLLAWLHLLQGDAATAQAQAASGLQWAARIEDTDLRALSESQLLTIQSMVSKEQLRFDEARQSLLALLARGEALSSARLQSSAMDNLADIAGRQGHWEEVIAWAQRSVALARLSGSLRDLARAHSRLGQAAWSLGMATQAQAWCTQALDLHRRVGDRHMQSVTLTMLAWLAFDRDEIEAAWALSLQAQALHASPTEGTPALEAASLGALCQARLGHDDSARQAVDTLLENAQALSRWESMDTRWTCCLALQALGDARAAPLLATLYADVLDRVAELTSEADRERLMQATPMFRDIAAASRPAAA